MSEKEIPLHVVYVESWIINDKKELLLAQRSSTDDNEPGVWTSPGGKIDVGEATSGIVEETLSREVLEEVGVVVENPRYLESGSFYRSSGHHVVRMSFLVDYVSGDPQPLEDQDAVKWVNFDEARELIKKYNYAALDKIIELSQID